MKNPKIGSPFGIGFGAVLPLQVVVAGVGMHGVNRAEVALDAIVGANVDKMNLVQDARESIHIWRRDGKP